MKASTRRKRAVLRDRRRDNRDEWLNGPPLIGPMTGFDLFLLNQYATLRAVAQRVRPPEMSPEAMDQQVRQVLRSMNSPLEIGALAHKIISGELPDD